MNLLIFQQYQRGSREWKQAILLRRRELRIPLGLDYSEADLASEAKEWHFAALTRGRLVASLNMKPAGPGVWKMRQVVVHPRLRGQGIGSNLVRFSEEAACRHGIRRVVLHARANVVPFYESLGYVADGPEFFEVSIAHRRMHRLL
ncbi:MAG: GNAT family N-acetyltransferase [Verrucomicrobiales bacterium]|nr:GNAT family N-acetyltransferase [Verrucomicrobiales bacterium]